MFLLLLSQDSLSEIRGTFLHSFIQICKRHTSTKCFKMWNNFWRISHLLIERARLIPCQFFCLGFSFVSSNVKIYSKCLLYVRQSACLDILRCKAVVNDKITIIAFSPRPIDIIYIYKYVCTIDFWMENYDAARKKHFPMFVNFSVFLSENLWISSSAKWTSLTS